MSMPPITERTAHEIVALLEHQYGVPCAAVVVVITKEDVERVETLLEGKQADRMPVISSANIHMPERVGMAVVANAAEANRMIFEQRAALEQTKGNA